MPNVNMKGLTRTIENESDPRAKLRLLACRERKKGHSIRKIAKYLGMAYSTTRDWLVRIVIPLMIRKTQPCDIPPERF